MSKCPLPDCVATREALARELAYRTLEEDLAVSREQEDETWIQTAFSNEYEVSSWGRVRSVDRVKVDRRGARRTYRGRVRVPWVDAWGYHILKIGLVTRRVHHIVIQAFVGPAPEAGMICLHWDGNPGNNRIENLRWGTLTENQRDAVRHRTHKNSKRTRCPRGHLLALPNLRANGLRKGQRNCLACYRASTRMAKLKNAGHDGDFVALSHMYYERITSGTPPSCDLDWGNRNVPPPESASDESAPALRRDEHSGYRPTP